MNDKETQNGQEEIENQEDIVEEKDQKIEELQEELEKAQDKDINFKKFREKKDKEIEKLQGEKEEAEEKIESLNETVEEKISKVRDEFASDKLWSEINDRAGGDKEVAEKIKSHYDSFKGEPESEEEKEKRLNNAEILATGGKPETLSGGAVSSGVGSAQTQDKKPDVKPEVKNFGKEKFGLEDEDFGDKNE